MKTYQEFNDFCSAFEGTSHVVQWGGSQVWKVSDKVFAIGGWEKKDDPAITFKTSEQNFHFLSEKPGYQPAPYFASRGMKWIQLYDLGEAEGDELEYYLKQSYDLVVAGLTKKKQQQLQQSQ